ncbi:phosphoketolase, partial [Micromonospora fiedleri]|nr:phosphoketolase [Micromonospora fiedleri]
LPIRHLTRYTLANQTVLDRIPESDLLDMLRGYGYQPYVVAGDEPAAVHELLAATFDRALDEIAEIQRQARSGATVTRPRWPMIGLRTPKGWTGPSEVDGKQVEGTYRAHQVPLSQVPTNPAHRAELERWLRSYRPEELFDATGAPVAELAALPPTG